MDRQQGKEATVEPIEVVVFGRRLRSAGAALAAFSFGMEEASAALHGGA